MNILSGVTQHARHVSARVLRGRGCPTCCQRIGRLTVGLPQAKSLGSPSPDAVYQAHEAICQGSGFMLQTPSMHEVRAQAPGAQAVQQRTLADIILDRIKSHEGGANAGDPGCAATPRRLLLGLRHRGWGTCHLIP